MDQNANHPALTPSVSHRNRWLALLEKNGVRRPKALYAAEVPGGLVQATIGEPGGQMQVEPAPAHVLMFNFSPVQALRQSREGRAFVSDMLQGEMTLMPAGVASEWSWNSTCDRLDVAVLPEVFGDGRSLEVVDRFLFRDERLATICRRLYQEIIRDGLAMKRAWAWYPKMPADSTSSATLSCIVALNDRSPDPAQLQFAGTKLYFDRGTHLNPARLRIRSSSQAVNENEGRPLRGGISIAANS